MTMLSSGSDNHDLRERAGGREPVRFAGLCGRNDVSRKKAGPRLCPSCAFRKTGRLFIVVRNLAEEENCCLLCAPGLIGGRRHCGSRGFMAAGDLGFRFRRLKGNALLHFPINSPLNIRKLKALSCTQSILCFFRPEARIDRLQVPEKPSCAAVWFAFCLYYPGSAPHPITGLG